MKNLYKCEKCGFQSENWDAVNECERKHLRLDGRSINDEFENKIEYDEGRQLPRRFMIHTDIPSTWNPETQKSEEGLPFYAVYKLEKVLSKAEAEELNADRLAKAHAERIDWMNYTKGVMDRAVAAAALDAENEKLAADAERAIKSYKSAARSAGFDPDELMAVEAAAKAAPAEAAGESHGTFVLEISEPVAKIIEAAIISDCSPEEATPMSAVEAIVAGAAE